MKTQAYITIFFIGVFAVWLRSDDIGKRPMHTDEAVAAAKLGLLLDEGVYVYDRHEYHGPTLNYLTLFSTWINGEYSYEELTIETLRYFIVFLGMLLVALPIWVFLKHDFKLAILITFLLGISPAMVFYSRYYIHEFILVLFTYLSVFSYIRWIENRSIVWSFLLGLCLGMMIATKETWIILVTAFVFAISITGNRNTLLYFFSSRHIIVAITGVVLIIVPFYSSFFSNMAGLSDMFTAYETYLGRAAAKEIHRHPWYYYIQLLSYNRGLDHFWTEIPMLILCCMGGYFVIVKGDDGFVTRSLRIIGVFSLFLLVVYSILPYKTPWNLLTFYFGMILLAGYGLATLLRAINSNYLRIGIVVVFGFVSIQLVGQSLSEIERPADPSNPWVYGHTDGNFHQVIQRVDSLAIDESTYIEVIFPGNDYWPFPWYLKNYNQVAYRNQISFDAPNGEMILIAQSAQDQLVEKLYDNPGAGERFLYLYLFDSIQSLRPNVYFQGYLRQDLWEKNQITIIEND